MQIDICRHTFDSGILGSFLQRSRANTRDTNKCISNLDYCGIISDILRVSFRRFEMFLLDVKWFKVIERGCNATIRRDVSGLVQVDSTKVWTDASDTLALLEHCEHVLFVPDPQEPQWWFVVQVAPRNRHVFEGQELLFDSQPDDSTNTMAKQGGK
ncbi:hypothetical protein L7F22_060367 [Adiantum nelumboides]|nr:hypothetical protein [Adiantum nelumboides]